MNCYAIDEIIFLRTTLAFLPFSLPTFFLSFSSLPSPPLVLLCLLHFSLPSFIPFFFPPFFKHTLRIALSPSTGSGTIE